MWWWRMDLMCHSDSQQASSLLQGAQAVIQIQLTMSAIYWTEFSYPIQVLTAIFKTQKSLQNTTRANERINRTYPNEVDEGAAAAVSLWQILHNNEFPIPFFIFSRYESCSWASDLDQSLGVDDHLSLNIGPCCQEEEVLKRSRRGIDLDVSSLVN